MTSPHLNHDQQTLFSAIEQLDLHLQRYTLMRRPALEAHVLEDFILDEERISQHQATSQGVPHWMQTPAIFNVGELPHLNASDCRLSSLKARFKLTEFEVNVLLLGLMPHMDSRYHSWFAALQRSEDKENPSIELALQLLAGSVEEQSDRQGDFLPDSTLLRHELISIDKSKQRRGEGWQQSLFQTPAAIYHYLFGHHSLASHLADCAKWYFRDSTQYSCPQTIREGMQAQVHNQQDNVMPIIMLKGPLGCGRLEAIAAEAATKNDLLLVLDVTKLPTERRDAKQALKEALREVRMRNGILVVRHWDEFSDSRQELLSDWVTLVKQPHVRIIGLCEQDSARTVMPNVTQIALEMPTLSYQEKLHILQRALSSEDFISTDTERLCRRFSFNQSSLNNILQEARCYRSLRDQDSPVNDADLNKAFRLHSQKNFGQLAHRIEPKRGFDDLIVADNLKNQLHELMVAIQQREQVLNSGFADKVGYGTGVSALFHGDSGLGKTMAAEVIAGQLGVDLIKVDLANVVDKYIGETEKHLARIFDLAEADAGVLFFDEADALFGKRSEASDSKDRHANIEVAYLLQRLENYPGLAILATNNRSHLDEAFSRRFTFITQFKAPDENTRHALWKSIWPEGCKLDPNLDLRALAARTQLTGANIRNIALLSAYFSAGENAPHISEHHILTAMQRELTKVGRLII
ncbi:ATP-binding protein [Vibrio sp. AND4]|uniref:ATP-binding protein n=1 Tax=Vibrio sp. AND4 TaxID=314289 RepID=UPI00015F2BE0|nr:ATP-binding protein [Vibrio sp. AND4]EDP57967.1 hypothetical protein AND4_05334 [Vibrio sp. AND4]